jgi:hypothetical protein
VDDRRDRPHNSTMPLDLHDAEVETAACARRATGYQ